MHSTQQHLPNLGCRISLHGNKGTIKYVGEVKGTHGSWLGIEWDNPNRGKHSGDIDGKQYFSCRVPGSGSFIRPSPSISYGQSFLHALISKYVEIPHSTGQKETVILGSSNGAIEVEAIGLDKVRGKLARLERLREISLDAEDVAFPDPPGEIRRTCLNVRHLDLSNNLLASWDSVALVTVELPALRALSLNCNRFEGLSDIRNLSSAFLALEELRLNETMTTWSETIILISIIPNLRILELGYNSMSCLGGTASENELPAAKLQQLNFDENKLQDWSDVLFSIAPFTKLERLILTSNRFQRIPQSPMLKALPNIKHVGLQENQFSQWRDIDSLNLWLPSLKTLNMSGNPLVSRSIDFRQQAIVRLPVLESLNGTPVSNQQFVSGLLISIKERIDSEIYYISQISRNVRSAEERERDFPRWKELCLKHGAPEEKTTTRTRDTLGDRLIKINVHFCCDPVEPESHTCSAATSSIRTFTAQLPPPSTLRVLPTMAVRLLRLKLLKGLKQLSDGKLQAPGLSVWMVMDDDTLTKIDLEQEDRDLGWWGIQEGSRLVIFTQKSDQD